MGRNRNRNRNKGGTQKVEPTSNQLNLNDIELMQQKLEIEKSLLIEKGLYSNDPYQILEAHRFLKKNGSPEEQAKAYLYNPDISSLNFNNYRVPTKKVSYETLKRMAKTPIVRTVIATRTDQVANFAEPTDSDQEKGWRIRKKKGVFQEEEELTDQEKREIEHITTFITEGGMTDDTWSFESFEKYLRMLCHDSLTIDQACCENIYSRGRKFMYYKPVDGSTIRLVDDTDPEKIKRIIEEVDGHLPKYVQTWNDEVVAWFYPWEMTFGVRNTVTDLNANGYGISELEDMVNIVTWLLFGMQYNGNFFSQGSNPKGFFTIKGAISPNSLSDFKQMWRNTISGVQNSHKVPVIESSSEIDWVDMQTSNKDMEFDNWLEFLIIITCCMYRIDPSECGFYIKKPGQVLGQDGQKERLKHSQTKGLTPILKMFQRMFTKYWVHQLNPKYKKYEFVFTGVETEDQQVALDMDVKKLSSGFLSLEDGFKKYSGRDFNPDKDTILNQVYQSAQQQKMMGGQGMNDMVEEEGPENVSPFAQDEDPFSKALVNWLEKGNIGGGNE